MSPRFEICNAVIHSAEVCLLTGESTPAGDIAGSIVGQDNAPVWEASGHDYVREDDRGRQLDQSNIVTAKDKNNRPTLRK